MYLYDQHDRQIAAERVEQFRDQTRRALAGELAEDEFLPCRTDFTFSAWLPCCASLCPTACCGQTSCAG